MPIPLVTNAQEPIASYIPTDAQKVTIAGTPLQVGGVNIAGYFDLLGTDTSLNILGNVNAAYNCIAWSTGITNRWINPPANANTYFTGLGYTLCTQGDVNKKIAVWFDGAGHVTHAAARKRVTIGGQSVACWTSKLGASFCISHSVDRLNGDAYGNPVMYFK